MIWECGGRREAQMKEEYAEHHPHGRCPPCAAAHPPWRAPMVDPDPAPSGPRLLVPWGVPLLVFPPENPRKNQQENPTLDVPFLYVHLNKRGPHPPPFQLAHVVMSEAGAGAGPEAPVPIVVATARSGAPHSSSVGALKFSADHPPTLYWREHPQDEETEELRRRLRCLQPPSSPPSCPPPHSAPPSGVRGHSRGFTGGGVQVSAGEMKERGAGFCSSWKLGRGLRGTRASSQPPSLPSPPPFLTA